MVPKPILGSECAENSTAARIPMDESVPKYLLFTTGSLKAAGSGDPFPNPPAPKDDDGESDGLEFDPRYESRVDARKVLTGAG